MEKKYKNNKIEHTGIPLESNSWKGTSHHSTVLN